MPVTRNKRQIFLFLAAIFVPAGALIELAGGLMYQDRELGAKRAVDQRRAAGPFSLTAGLLAARRATAIDPTAALRQD